MLVEPCGYELPFLSLPFKLWLHGSFSHIYTRPGFKG